jgi:tryptophan halogenase
LALKTKLPGIELVIVHSPDIPVIGVGESTTRAFPQFLHEDLKLDRLEFFREVQPSWKLGLRMEWGSPKDTHFNYPFDLALNEYPPGLKKTKAFCAIENPRDLSLFSALMDCGKSPCSMQGNKFSADTRSAYHLKNDRFIEYLKRKSVALGVEVIEGKVVEVQQEADGGVSALTLEDGRSIDGDFFIDCSGFRSLLLGDKLGEPYCSYEATLFCDAAVIGSWQRDDDVKPYTTVETMEHGWCWRIDFLDVVTRGYVFSTEFCDENEAMAEMKEKNPQLGDDLRVLKFPRGRRERFWVNNVAAIGNASGFVEPLEATALHLIVEQLHFLTVALADNDGRIVPAARDLENQRFRRIWDDVRDFLALHYRFNHKIDSAFWRHCHQHSDLGNAQQLVDYYQKAGPSTNTGAILDPMGIFGFDGYMIMLLGQRVPTDAQPMSNEENDVWEMYGKQLQTDTQHAIPMREILEKMYHPPNS